MTKLFRLAVLGLATLAWVGCDSNDDDPIDLGDDASAIQDTWVSEGSNVAPGLAGLFGTTRITATFSDNNTYTVIEERGADDPNVTYTGTYSTASTDVGDIRTITLTQGEPFAATSEGIYEIDEDGTMRYEVVQTQQDIGATPPTAAGGFGSTIFGGEAQGETFIQTFVRQ
jgi:hypothetical protein